MSLLTPELLIYSNFLLSFLLFKVYFSIVQMGVVENSLILITIDYCNYFGNWNNPGLTSVAQIELILMYIQYTYMHTRDRRVFNLTRTQNQVAKHERRRRALTTDKSYIYVNITTLYI